MSGVTKSKIFSSSWSLEEVIGSKLYGLYRAFHTLQSDN